ncbi:NAD(P)-dependent oxidoreductase [uncultured Olsenella sp.]|uniref:NAD(P)-dependent oxidoreductase n=1 Tax=uncultured Olsenella sp. TaxID=190764 RepID=UPI0026DCFA7C|nr:NAD(P)H-binding protein [uncultured Olsenella sp.]
MKKNIAVVAADGRVARKVITEAVGRGWDVTAFGRRDHNSGDAQTYVKRDIFDLTAEDLAGFDAVVDAFGAHTPETLPLHSTTLKHLLDLLSGTDVRLVVVGGAGSLYVDHEHKVQLYQTPDFPDAFKPTALAQVKTLDEIRGRDDVRWTFISPAGDFQADGERTGSYILGGEELTLNGRGESTISYADFALGLVDEIESGDHIRQRISFVRK